VAAPDPRDRLAELEMEHATFQSELDAFCAEYEARVGVIELQVQALEERLAEDPPEPDVGTPGSTTVTLELNPDPVAPPPDEDPKSLFRDAAKRMHPDLQPEPAGHAHAEAFMKRLNEAYAARDADAIGNLVRQWETSPYARSGVGSSPALSAAITQAEQRLAAVRESDLGRLMERWFQAQMEGRDLLQELRWRAEEQLADARIRAEASRQT
jgi:hypothetical protein